MEGGGNYRRELGRKGEDIACSLLEGMGHVILERNWRSGHLEIDIISKDPEGIHFVEVKTCRMNIQAPPQDSVDRIKQERTVKAALKYLSSEKTGTYGNMECMFDVIAVSFDGDKASTEWIPQAFIPIYF